MDDRQDTARNTRPTTLLTAYRGYFIDAAGHVAGLVTSTHENDERAIAWLRRELAEQQAYSRIELWDRARCVHIEDRAPRQG
jgi:hypothetical protein